jgi:hypothetical protein
MEQAKHRKEYSKPELLFGNLAIILWISLGAMSCMIYYPFSAILFFATAAFLIFYELGKKGCVTCYYCKTCTVGIGKLPEFFFRMAGTANVNSNALRLFPLVYFLLGILPIVLVTVSAVQGISAFKIVLLAGTLLFSAYIGIIRRKTLLHAVA